MSFGERIKALREDSDETQKEIADLIFVSNKVISDYERGIHFPRDEKAIVALAKHFNVSTDYLFGLTDIPNYSSLSAVFSEIGSLSPQSLTQLIDYIQYLTYKDKNAPQK